MREVVEQIFFDYKAKDRSRCFNGGDYDSGRSVFTDLWSGEVITELPWTSSNFRYCPICSQFCEHCHQKETEALNEFICSLHIVRVDIFYPERRRLTMAVREK